MKKFIIQAIALLVVVFLSLAYSTGRIPNFSGVSNPKPSSQPKQTLVLINNTQINVELADTSDKRKIGLGGRDSLASDSGMLFTFDKPGKYSFWMKGMKFPLDFIWIRSNKVVDLLINIAPPQPDQPDSDLPIYQSNTEVDSVLEVNAGFVDTHGIKFGDSLEVK